MSARKYLNVFALAVAVSASPAHAYFSETTSAATTTLTENFNDSGTSFTGQFETFAYGSGAGKDGAVWLHDTATQSLSSLSTSFTTFASVASLTLDFYYVGTGSVSLSNAQGSVLGTTLSTATGLNPGLGEAAQGNPGGHFSQTFSNLAAGSYTLSFGRVGGVNDYIKLDDVSIKLVSAVPEPSTIAMMLAGLAIVGVAARRKQSGKTPEA